MNTSTKAPRVSVIMPVYNTEPYLEEAVNSILNQTLRDIELVAVNDGSTDGSPAILERFAAQDPRVRVVSQPNAGLSATRNRGFELARGEYVYFMDSDDLLEGDALECCVTKCDAEKLDFVIFDADVLNDIPDHKFNPKYYLRSHKIADRVYTGLELFDTLLSAKGFRSSACLVLIRRDYLRRIDLRFHEGIIHEDELFTPLLYFPAERAGRIDRAFFHRRLRPFSIMTARDDRRSAEGYRTVLDELARYAHGKPPQVRARVVRRMRILQRMLLFRVKSRRTQIRWPYLRAAFSYPGVMFFCRLK